MLTNTLAQRFFKGIVFFSELIADEVGKRLNHRRCFPKLFDGGVLQEKRGNMLGILCLLHRLSKQDISGCLRPGREVN